MNTIKPTTISLLLSMRLITLPLAVKFFAAQGKNNQIVPYSKQTTNILANSTSMKLPNSDALATNPSGETFTFTTEEFFALLGAIGAAVFWITYKIRGVEKDVKHMKEDLEKNPYLKAFKQLEGNVEILAAVNYFLNLLHNAFPKYKKKRKRPFRIANVS